MSNPHTQPLKILYIASTHWDREWYLTYQSFRFRLVGALNEIVHTLESDDTFTRFLLDGQCILLEDYLEIQPEMRSRLESLLAEGRLIAGPWYTMPDESLVSGESLVSNLLLGTQFSGALRSGFMQCGYVCDIFGHVAQLPQILQGFNIPMALLGRGTNNKNTAAFFNWESPDGSSCVAFKVPESGGYGSFYFDVFKPYLDGRIPGREALLQRAIYYVERELARSPLPYVLLMDGMDHEKIHSEAPWLAQELSRHFGCPVDFASPDQLAQDLQEHAAKLNTTHGELRQTAQGMFEHNKLLTHTLSARYDIKLQNDSCQLLLERIAWPLACLSQLANSPVAPRFFTQAVKKMLASQSHDSICGCSIDAVCEDALHRYKHAENILHEIVDFSANHLAPLQDEIAPTSGPNCVMTDYSETMMLDTQARTEKANHLRLTVFNTEPFPTDDVIIADLDFPLGYTARYGEFLAYEPQNMFAIYNAQGENIPYQLLQVKAAHYASKPLGFHRVQRDRYRIALQSSTPAMGHSEYIVRPSETPVRNAGTLRSGELCSENTFVRLTVETDGTITMFDKATGQQYSNLLLLKDYGEVGDGWFHVPPQGNPTFYGAGSNTSIEVTADGSELCTFLITKRLRLPACTEGKPPCARRSAQTKTLTVRISATLTQTSRWAEIEVDVQNNVCDHRLSICFATNASEPEYEADQAFALITRKAPCHDTQSWKEFDSGYHNFSHLVMKRDKKTHCGMALLSSGGMHACKPLPDSCGTMEITLFRSFANTFLTNGETGCQLQGNLHFRFALLPVSENDTAGDIIRLRDRFTNRPFGYSSIVSKNTAAQAEKASFMLTAKNVCLSTIKPGQAANTLCARLVNYGAEEETVFLDCPASIVAAYTTNLAETDRTPLPITKNRITLSIKGAQVYTVLVSTAP